MWYTFNFWIYFMKSVFIFDSPCLTKYYTSTFITLENSKKGNHLQKKGHNVTLNSSIANTRVMSKFIYTKTLLANTRVFLKIAIKTFCSL